MNEEIKEILNKIYEAEGLLELMRLRQEKAPELYPMIVERLAEVNRMVGAMNVEASANVSPEIEHTSSAVDDPIDEIEYDLDEGLEESGLIEEPKKRPALCLNDRFRFRRALFGGNDSELNAVLDHIAMLGDFDEAENYLYGVLGFEPDDEDVADFMEIIKSYFEQ